MNREIRNSTMSSISSTSTTSENASITKRNRTNSYVGQFFTELIESKIAQATKSKNARWGRSNKIFPQRWQNLAIQDEEEIFEKSIIVNLHDSSPSLLSEGYKVKNTEAVSGTDKIVVKIVSSSESVKQCDISEYNGQFIDANEALAISERMGLIAPRLGSRIPVRARKSLPDSLTYNMSKNDGLDINRCIRKHANIKAANEGYDQIIQHVQQHKDLMADIHRVQEKMAALKTKIEKELT